MAGRLVLLQRTDDDCRKLFEQAGYNMDELESVRDESGIIINYIARSKVPAFVRLDAPEALSAPECGRTRDVARRSHRIARARIRNSATLYA